MSGNGLRFGAATVHRRESPVKTDSERGALLTTARRQDEATGAEATPDKEVLSVAEVAAWLGRHPVAVQQAARAGRLPARRIGKEWRFGREHVIEHLQRPRGATGPSRAVPAFADEASLGASLTSAEAAELLSVKPRAIYSEVTAGRLPGWKEGGQWRFDRGELLRHLRGDPDAEAERYRRGAGTRRGEG